MFNPKCMTRFNSTRRYEAQFLRERLERGRDALRRAAQGCKRLCERRVRQTQERVRETQMERDRAERETACLLEQLLDDVVWLHGELHLACRQLHALEQHDHLAQPLRCLPHLQVALQRLDLLRLCRPPSPFVTPTSPSTRTSPLRNVATTSHPNSTPTPTMLNTPLDCGTYAYASTDFQGWHNSS